ncbi:MAG TPA: DNA repair protein RecO [Candidatus Chromulinivoraceae bacterium]|nr:DNA repair protein RecO [Candidatus Chromulinivoraceae bacterium]
MTTIRTQAIVLRRTNYGEADRILHLLTPEGKRNVMARGVRREKSKLAGGIELFAVSDVVISSGRGELGILTSARLIQFYRHILEDYDTMQFGYEVVKQVSRATETVDEPEWFEVLQEVFMGLDVKTIPRGVVEIWFYLRYATLLGRELSLTNDINGQKLSSDQVYLYDVGEQGLRAAVNGDLTADHIKFLRLVNAKSLKVLAQIGGIEPILPACLRTARQHAAIAL